MNGPTAQTEADDPTAPTSTHRTTAGDTREMTHAHTHRARRPTSSRTGPPAATRHAAVPPRSEPAQGHLFLALEVGGNGDQRNQKRRPSQAHTHRRVLDGP